MVEPSQMEEVPRPRPSGSATHNPVDLHFPSVPKSELSQPHVQGEITLPDLRTVLSPGFQHDTPSKGEHERGGSGAPASPRSARSLPRIDPGPQYEDAVGTRRSEDAGLMSPSDAGDAMSVDEQAPATRSAASTEDHDMLMAAEALSGLGNPGMSHNHMIKERREFAADDSRLMFKGYKRNSVNGIPSSREMSIGSGQARHVQQEGATEPLLELFTRAHPWVGGTINGSLSAYSTTKHYSPRFVQYGANVVERSITTPVTTMGRVTGVESGLRWWYRDSHADRPGDLERGDEDFGKRRKLDGDDMDVTFTTARIARRRDSQESRTDSLPSYCASRPPLYSEEQNPTTDRSVQNRSWPSQVFVMTSGLGVALSITSRRSLRFCLQILSSHAQHVTTVMDALKLVLQQYDEARDAWHQQQDGQQQHPAHSEPTCNPNPYPTASEEKSSTPTTRPRTPDHDEAARRLAALIQHHSQDIWKTLQEVVSSISAYAGGALPDNARQFVRTQLLSLPQRWRVVSSQNDGRESETSRGAHRMIAFATEGLDMMGQVSEAMRLTLESAERWLERAGRGGEGGEGRQRPGDEEKGRWVEGTAA